MPCLLDVQRGFRTALLTGDGASLAAAVIGGRVSAAARLDIYRNNVTGNLTRALRLSYPAVERLVGEDFFAAAARRFIVASPPNVADLNQYGEGFADFLTSFEAAASVPYLPDVARLEWAVNRALHTPAAPSLTPEALIEVPAERQAALRFRAHPTVSLLSLNYPARAIWDAVLTDDADERSDQLAAIDIEAGGEALAVLRRDGALDIDVLSDPAFELAHALTGGRLLGEALEGIAPDDAAPLLADFLIRGFFAGFHLPTENAPIKKGSMS
jgi:hypothetical protein